METHNRNGYEVFVNRFSEMANACFPGRIFPQIFGRRDTEQTFKKNLESLLSDPNAKTYLINLYENLRESKTRTLTPLHSMGIFSLIELIGQSITSIFHYRTKNLHINWEDTSIPDFLMNGPLGPDGFWRERIHDHGYAFILSGIAAFALLLHSKQRKSEKRNEEIKRVLHLNPHFPDREHKSIDISEINPREALNKKSLRDLVGYILNPNEQRPMINYTTALLLAAGSIAYGALYHHGETPQILETTVKNLCCRPGNARREQFTPDMISYFTSYKPLFWALGGAAIDPFARIIRKMRENYNRVDKT